MLHSKPASLSHREKSDDLEPRLCDKDLQGLRTQAEEAEDEPRCCWVCLGDSSGEGEPPVRSLCRCPSRFAHDACLGRWQLQQAGKSEEWQCRFCSAQLPDYRKALSQGLPPPADCALASIHHEGKTYSMQMYPGEEGKLRFLTEVRRLLGLSETTVINVNFECAAPPAIASAASMPSGGGGGGGVDELCGQVSQLSLKGLGTWDAAVFCATMAASQKAVAAADVTAGGRDAGQQLQRQQQQQQQSQSQQQQLQSVDALAAVDPELLYWTRLGPQPMPSPSRQQSQRAATGDLLSHHLSGPRLLLSPRQTIPTAAMSAGGEEPVGPTSASASASNALLSASIVAATSPQPFSGSGGLHSAPYAAAAAVTPSHPPQGALSPRAQAARPPQRTAAAVAAVEGHSVSVAVAGVGDRLLASSAALPRHALAGSLLRQVQQVWMDILPRCH